MTDAARPEPDETPDETFGEGDPPPARPASERLTPGGARLRNRPEPEPQPDVEDADGADSAVGTSDGEGGVEATATDAAIPVVDDDPDRPLHKPQGIMLKKYYIGVISLLVGLALGAYAFVDVWDGRKDGTGGLTLVTTAKMLLGGALLVYGQGLVRAATNDPRARKR